MRYASTHPHSRYAASDADRLSEIQGGEGSHSPVIRRYLASQTGLLNAAGVPSDCRISTRTKDGRRASTHRIAAVSASRSRRKYCTSGPRSEEHTSELQS